MAAVADSVGGPSWAHLDPNYNLVREWSGLLDALSLDAQNRKSLDELVHMGAAGQAEANRLVYTWVKPASFNWRPYKNPPQVYQKSIANAMKNVAHAAERPVGLRCLVPEWCRASRTSMAGDERIRAHVGETQHNPSLV